MYLGASLATKLKVAIAPPKLPRAIWKAVPTLRLKCPLTIESGYQTTKLEERDVDSRLVLNQQTTIGVAENSPIATRNNAPYLTFMLPWKVKRTTIPMTEMSINGRIKMYLLL